MFSKLFSKQNYRLLYHGDQKISCGESAGGGWRICILVIDQLLVCPNMTRWELMYRCTLYIVEVQRTLCSCLFAFKSDGINLASFHQARRSRRCGVWKAACAVRTSRNRTWRWRGVTSSKPKKREQNRRQTTMKKCYSFHKPLLEG